LHYKIINRKKRLAARAGDLVGKIAFFPGLILKKDGTAINDNIRRILVIRTAYIGDVILTLPILSPLRALFPHAQISFLTTGKARELLETNPFVDRIIAYDAFWFYGNHGRSTLIDYLNIIRLLKSESYDLVIEARGDIRDISLLAYPTRSRYRISYGVGGGAFLLTHTVPFRGIGHKILYHMDIVKYLGSQANSFEWDLYLNDHEKHLADHLLEKKGVPHALPMVAIHPGGRKELKRWYPEGFAEVASRLAEAFNALILIMGGPDDVKIAKQVERAAECKCFMLAGETSLRLMGAILEKCDLFICNDSCALHVASMMGTPTVAIFGPSKSAETGPFGNTHVIVEKPFNCRYDCDENECRHSPRNECLTSITADDVFNAAHDVCKMVFTREKSYDKP